MKTAILIDLDGTLLPLNDNAFFKSYIKSLSNFATKLNYDLSKFCDAIFDGINKMYSNNGETTNEQVFWECFENKFDTKKLKDKKIFNKYYENEFNALKAVTWENPFAKDFIALAKQKFDYVIIATNPLFPKLATFARINWLGFKPENFDLITTYENSHFSKPNPKYYLEILNKFNLKPENCIMVGNDEKEDYLGATSAGIKTYLVGDCIIKNLEKNENIKHYTFNELMNIIKNEY